MRRLFPFLLLGIIYFVSSSHSIAYEWYLLENKFYKASFPGKPASDSLTSEHVFGKVYSVTYMYEPAENLADSNLMYILSEVEYPDSSITSDNKEFEDGFFEAAVNSSVKKVGGKLISEKAINLNGYPGRSLIIDYGNGAAKIRADFYLVNNKSYSLQVLAYSGMENNATSDKFINSFSLK